jgi:putative tricarboxylic transport membrane protein
MTEILLAVGQGFLILFMPENFLFMLIGIVLGMFFGIIPGLGGLIGMGLLLPFAFGMEAQPAFAFLLGMFAVTTQTDTIPAVLIGVPGTSQAQATYLDGYPMAKNGEAGRALSASYFASIFGTIVSLIIFIFLLPVVKVTIDQFGSPEFFMLSVWGLVMAGSLAGTSVFRGLAVIGLGLTVSAIGFSPNAELPRYVFDIDYLESGLPIIPIVLGLFAIPEVIDLMITRRSIAEGTEPRGGMVEGLTDNFREWLLVLKTSTVGAICGMIPGLGGTVAEWLGYGIAVNSSKDSSRFGKGDVRGVIAPEAATAGQKPGGLLPTVAFGIPGNGGMAILLGAFLVVGLNPGKAMLEEQLPLTFMMVWTVVIANIIAAILALGLQGFLVKICYVRATILGPIVLSFMAVGAVLATREFEDLVVFGVFGVIGYVFKHTDWPRVPLLIGIILGKLAEPTLLITVKRYGFDWLWDRPIVVALEALIILPFLYRAYKNHKNRPKPGFEK